MDSAARKTELHNKVMDLMEGVLLSEAVLVLGLAYAEVMAMSTEYRYSEDFSGRAAGLINRMYQDVCNANQEAPEGATLN